MPKRTKPSTKLSPDAAIALKEELRKAKSTMNKLRRITRVTPEQMRRPLGPPNISL